jgi:hypothetical protein
MKEGVRAFLIFPSGIRWLIIQGVGGTAMERPAKGQNPSVDPIEAVTEELTTRITELNFSQDGQKPEGLAATLFQPGHS